jgi:lipopolysaccharide biosynthesis protein
MKTLVLFAHHDVGNTIDPHVMRYLEELHTLGDTTLIFVSDPWRNRPMNAEALQRLMPLCNEFHSEHTPSRDFGSWRIAWEIAKQKGWIKDCDRLVLANDSVYGGLFPLKEMWDTFTGADMYGAIESEEGGMESFFETFFIVFDMNKKTRPFLDKFWEDFEFIEPTEEYFRRYEGGIARGADDAGLVRKPFVSITDFKTSYQQARGRAWDDDFENYTFGGATWCYWYGLIHYHRLPFVKVKVARMNERGLREVLERHTDYPFGMIESHVERINGISWFTRRGDPRMACPNSEM